MPKMTIVSFCPTSLRTHMLVLFHHKHIHFIWHKHHLLTKLNLSVNRPKIFGCGAIFFVKTINRDNKKVTHAILTCKSAEQKFEAGQELKNYVPTNQTSDKIIIFDIEISPFFQAHQFAKNKYLYICIYLIRRHLRIYA